LTRSSPTALVGALSGAGAPGLACAMGGFSLAVGANMLAKGRVSHYQQKEGGAIMFGESVQRWGAVLDGKPMPPARDRIYIGGGRLSSPVTEPCIEARFPASRQDLRAIAGYCVKS
jgi:hypothetical protein